MSRRTPPPWLDTLAPDSDYVREQVCPRCRQTVIRALVGRVAGLDIRADPVPLTAAAELQARLAGRFTWCLSVPRHGRARLLDRGAEHIAAGRCTHIVVASHECRARRQLPADPIQETLL